MNRDFWSFHVFELNSPNFITTTLRQTPGWI
jgi:hypothetical protein